MYRTNFYETSGSTILHNTLVHDCHVPTAEISNNSGARFIVKISRLTFVLDINLSI